MTLNKIIIILSFFMVIFIMSLHLIYEILFISQNRLLWFWGFKIQATIIIDLIIWSMLLIQFTIMYLSLNKLK